MTQLRVPRAHAFARSVLVDCAPCELPSLRGSEGYVEAWGILTHVVAVHGAVLEAGTFIAIDPDVAQLHVELREAHVVLGHELPVGTYLCFVGERLTSALAGLPLAPIIAAIGLARTARRLLFPADVIVVYVSHEQRELRLRDHVVPRGEQVALRGDGSVARRAAPGGHTP